MKKNDLFHTGIYTRQTCILRQTGIKNKMLESVNGNDMPLLYGVCVGVHWSNYMWH